MLKSLFQNKIVEDLKGSGFLLKSKAYKDIPRIKTVMFDIGAEVLFTKQCFILAGYSPSNDILSEDKNHPALQYLRRMIAPIPLNKWDRRCSLTEWIIDNQEYCLSLRPSDNKIYTNVTGPLGDSVIVIDNRNKFKATHKLNENGEVVEFTNTDKQMYDKAVKQMLDEIGCSFCSTLYQIIESPTDGNAVNNVEESDTVIMLGLLGFGNRIIPEAKEMLNILKQANLRIIPISGDNEPNFRRRMKLCEFGNPEFFFSGAPLGKVEGILFFFHYFVS